MTDFIDIKPKQDKKPTRPRSFIQRALKAAALVAGATAFLYLLGSATHRETVPLTEETADYEVDYVLATDDDFSLIENDNAPNGKDYYVYTGNADYVHLPETIHDEPLETTYRMFANTSVKGVAGTIPTLTSIRQMFLQSEATSIDISQLDTENVTDMYGVFWQAEATHLNVSNVQTDKVTDMTNMFRDTKAETLDLSDFDTSSEPIISAMFYGAQITTGYARTVDDQERFNDERTNRSDEMAFTVK